MIQNAKKIFKNLSSFPFKHMKFYSFYLCYFDGFSKQSSTVREGGVGVAVTELVVILPAKLAHFLLPVVCKSRTACSSPAVDGTGGLQIRV